MIPEAVIGIVLALLVGAATTSLWLDARERRMLRQLAVALPGSEAATLLSIRRSEARSRSLFISRLINYRAEIPYTLHPAYVLLAGALAAAAIFYANRLLDY